MLVANEVFGKDFSLELTAPTALDSTLVHQYIAFHFDDGWDCGQIGRKVDSSKHTEGFNYDVRYPSRGGTVFPRLQLNLYGVVDEGPHRWCFGWCCPVQCYHSVSLQSRNVVGCVRGLLMDFLSRRDRFLY